MESFLFWGFVFTCLIGYGAIRMLATIGGMVPGRTPLERMNNGYKIGSKIGDMFR